jgi:3-deoxy-manno-octulosonate cytidylyltransferase (CMP-KDO synthetase)
MNLDIALFIPARLASQRLPGKPLIPIRGRDGHSRPLIQHCWDAAARVPDVGSIHVLTDNDQLAEVVAGFGGQVLRTSDQARNGSERCAEALTRLDRIPDVVVNLQADAFLTPPKFVTAVAAIFTTPSVKVATPVFRARGDALGRLDQDRAAGRIGGTTAVLAADGRALYFSKSVLPSEARRGPDDTEWPVYHHVGLYAYRPEALREFADLPQGKLEVAEGLEQLRFLEHGIDVHCVEVEPPPHGFWEVNNPEDIAVVEAMIADGRCG